MRTSSFGPVLTTTCCVQRLHRNGAPRWSTRICSFCLAGRTPRSSPPANTVTATPGSSSAPPRSPPPLRTANYAKEPRAVRVVVAQRDARQQQLVEASGQQLLETRRHHVVVA